MTAEACLDEKRTSIRAVRRIARLEVLVVLGSLLLPALLFGLAAWQNYREILQASEERVASTARILQEHAAKVFETHRLVIDQVNTRIRFMDWAREQDVADLHGVMRELQERLDQVATITLTDRDGRLRASSRLYPADASLTFTDRDWFQALQASAPVRPFVSRAYVGRQSGQAVFNVAGRAFSEDESFAGAVAVSVDRAYFDAFYRRIGSDPTHSVVLVREDGTILARDPRTSQVVLDQAGAFFTWQRRGKPDQVVHGRAVRDGIERTYGFRQVGQYPVYVGYGLTRETALAPWRQNLELYGLVAALVAAALLAASALAIRRWRREMAAVAKLEAARRALALSNERLEQKVAERTAELRESHAEMQRYAYIVSHDLRAPLVNVMGFSRELSGLKPSLLAAATLPASERQEVEQDFDEALGFISAAILKMEGLIASVLKVSREGRRRLVPEPLAMTPVVQGVADALRHQADVAGATVAVGTLPDIAADRLAVEHIFGNLLDNALKYLDPKRPGRIAVTGARSGDAVRFEVVDNGRGIAASDHERVFELFRRAGSPDRPGEGIGLAHVRALVRAMGGRIELSSQLDRGATFRVTLPVRFRSGADDERPTDVTPSAA